MKIYLKKSVFCLIIAVFLCARSALAYPSYSPAPSASPTYAPSQSATLTPAPTATSYATPSPSGSCSTGDSDGDGVNDCVDQCDATKPSADDIFYVAEIESGCWVMVKKTRYEITKTCNDSTTSKAGGECSCDENDECSGSCVDSKQSCNVVNKYDTKGTEAEEDDELKSSVCRCTRANESLVSVPAMLIFDLDGALVGVEAGEVYVTPEEVLQFDFLDEENS